MSSSQWRSTVLYPNILNSRSNSYEVEESDAKGPATLNEQHSRRSASSTPPSSYDSGPDIPFHAATTSTPTVTVTRHSHSPVTAAAYSNNNNKPTADPPNNDNTDTDTDIPNPFSISSKPIKGPPIPFPRYLQAEIAKWHEATRGQRRKKRPPFSYRGEGVVREYKVFDRTGQELQLCQYPLKSPRTNVLVAYEATATAGAGPPRTGSGSEASSASASASAPPGGKIVVCSLPHSSPFGTFLRQWTPADQDVPPPSCAVRVWRMKPGQEIVYDPAAWEFIDGRRERERQQHGEGGGVATADVRPRPQERRASERGVPARSARSKSAQQQQQKVVANATRVASMSSDRDTSPLSELVDDTEEESSSVSEPIQQTRRIPKRQQQPAPTSPSSSSPPVPKRRKTNHADPLSLRKVTGGLVFVLCSEDKPKRFVFVATCNTVDDLFAQALDFFRLHYKLTELKYLCCETEAHGEVWLPRGGHDEFDYMIWVALDSLKGKDNVPAVEIKVRPVIIP
ncbi:uncharacterized protein BO66DRAFT_432180 [Aspergillus aculeatinus CBS 121060]|uniref:Uncharacterized protein n=1 Tax=Aspergillus aculeatinus CBS 121060 TaxID=1448322 RepID=A0ACD1GVG4_9EURO|nr:hypothetical protein BO66DRAFT_432180 [Aspergillus aculeatinus CBS 121060]RAH65163.1 hypothetical protein BO66DRAFT_432180 [Aspergillus aculeatinus CBS 121060]